MPDLYNIERLISEFKRDLPRCSLLSCQRQSTSIPRCELSWILNIRRDTEEVNTRWIRLGEEQSRTMDTFKRTWGKSDQRGGGVWKVYRTIIVIQLKSFPFVRHRGLVGWLPLERRKETVRFSQSVCIFFYLSFPLPFVVPFVFSFLFEKSAIFPGFTLFIRFFLFSFFLSFFFFFHPDPTRVCLCKNLPMKSTLSLSLSLSLAQPCAPVSETVRRGGGEQEEEWSAG